MAVQVQAADTLEQFLATRAPELREKLILDSVPLVHYLLARMGISRETANDYEDLAHQGLLGLIDAVDHFDPGFSTRFSTYASTRIRGKILDYLRASDWMPRTARKRARRIDNAISLLWSSNLREPTEEEIAAHLGMQLEDVQQGLADSNRVLVSLDQMSESGPENAGSLHERLSDEHQADPSAVLESEALVEELAHAIQDLPERERLVLSLYYNDELTFSEIGKVLGITESRVCQLHARSVMTLKGIMQNEQPDTQSVP